MRRKNAALATALANVVQREAGSFLGMTPGLDAAALREHPDLPKVDAAVRRVTRGSRVLKVKIYAAEGTTIYSSDPRQIGEDKSGNIGFASAMAGTISSDLTFRDQFDAFEGTLASCDVLFSYVPPYDDPGSAFAGVFEIYTDITELKEQVETETLVGASAVAAVFAVVYLLLLCTVLAGSRVIARQHAENVALAADAARADAANEAKSEFLMTMSHERRTPLNAIIGFAEIIKDEVLGGAASAKYRSCAEDIHSAGIHLLKVINDVLDFVKIDTGAKGRS